MAPKAVDSDLIVVGGGPAGSAAAIVAARSGLDVTLIDKASFPRTKCCGDGLTAGCLRHLETLGLDPDKLKTWQWVSDVTLVSPSGHEIVFDLPRGKGRFAAAARRSELDEALLALAREAGANVIEECSIAGLRQDSSQVKITTSGKGSDGSTIMAPWLIAADGMWSPTRKLLGHQMAEYRGDWHAFRQYFVGVSPKAQSELVCWFEPDILPGYFWSFPIGDGSANVGFGVLRGGRVSTKEMKALWPDLLSRPHIAKFLGPDAQPEDRHSAWPIPARLGEFELSDGRVIFVGDAAMASDPMSGEGIGQAIETGMLAANVIAAAGDDSRPSDVTSDYTSQLIRGMQKDHRMASLLGRFLANEKAARTSIRIAGSTAWTRRNFARWLFEDYPRSILLTPRRWTRDVFNRRGAFVSSD